MPNDTALAIGSEFVECQRPEGASQHGFRLTSDMDQYLFNGRVVRFRVEGDGPNVVFLHNAGTDHTIWSAVSSRLSGHRRILVDLPGFGDSEPPESWTADAYGRTVIALLEHLHIPSAHWVGHCVGATSALAASHRQPSAVRSLSLVSPASSRSLAWGPYGLFPSWAQIAPSSFSSVGRVVARLQAAGGASLAVRSQFGRTPPAELHRHLTTRAANSSSTAGLAAVVKAMPTYDSQLHPPQAPVQLAWGRLNTVLPVWNRHGVASAIDASEVRVIHGAGHLCMAEEPSLFARWIQDWVATHS